MLLSGQGYFVLRFLWIYRKSRESEFPPTRNSKSRKWSSRLPRMDISGQRRNFKVTEESGIGILSYQEWISAVREEFQGQVGVGKRSSRLPATGKIASETRSYKERGSRLSAVSEARKSIILEISIILNIPEVSVAFFVL